MRRFLVGAVPPILLTAGFLWLHHGGRLLCPFYEITGFYCPGCGTGRAVLSLMNGDFTAAVLYNPLLFLLGIPSMVLLGWEYLRYLFPKAELKRISLPRHTGAVCLSIIVLYWILRNLSLFSFLAP